MSKRYLAISGGIGGAKLALGLSHCLPADQLMFAVNTGDDFEHFGLHISPDIDTLTYTLADRANKEVGWGRADETWHFMEALGQLGGENWFNLGDRDLALHTQRTQRLKQGATLTKVTAEIATALGVAHTIAPMSDDPVRTQVQTTDGVLAFQHYFVRDRCEPTVTGFEFAGIESSQPNPVIAEFLKSVDGIIICPSNPFVSVDPLLKIPGMRAAMQACGAPIIAVSPIVGGTAIKGPTAKMMTELAVPATAAQVANHYGDLLSGFLLDDQDAELHNQLQTPTFVAPSVMVTLQDRVDLANNCLTFLDELSR